MIKIYREFHNDSIILGYDSATQNKKNIEMNMCLETRFPPGRHFDSFTKRLLSYEQFYNEQEVFYNKC